MMVALHGGTWLHQLPLAKMECPGVLPIAGPIAAAACLDGVGESSPKNLPNSPKTLGYVSFGRCGDPDLPTTTALSLSLELCQIAPGPAAR